MAGQIFSIWLRFARRTRVCAFEREESSAYRVPRRVVVKPRPAPLRERFVFPSDFVQSPNDPALSSRLVDVVEVRSGLERTLRLWRKTGSPADRDLRALWRHEVRHVQRVMSYAQARDVVVEAVEVVEDEDYFGLVLVRAGQPLARILKSASPRYWMRRLQEPGARNLFWANMRRIVTALGILHAQGLVHGNISPEVITTEGFEEPDFRLTGFEWSLWLAADPGGSETPGGKIDDRTYSFEGDWRALGQLVGWLLGVVLTQAGDVRQDEAAEGGALLGQGERQLIRRLVAPASTESLDAPALVRTIDDLVVSLAKSAAGGAAPLLILTFASWDRLGNAICDASDGEIAADDTAAQLHWIQGDLASGATLLVPRDFDRDKSRLRLVTGNMVYELAAFRDRNTAVATWELAVCRTVQTRKAALFVTNEDEHRLAQTVTILQRFAEAQSLRERRAVDIVDWSSFAAAQTPPVVTVAADVGRALLLAQILEALIRTLENYPVEVLSRANGRVLIRAEDESERDAFAKRVGLGTTADALHRLFDQDQRDAGLVWRLGRSPNLGASTLRDAEARFVEVSAVHGAVVYEFEVDRDVVVGDTYFLRPEQELGTEQVIRRRLRNLAMLESQVDLARALDKPLYERRKSPESIDLEDAELRDLDRPKQAALRAIFETLPSFFVVGPPGVGKTKLATEVVRRSLRHEPSTRMLISAQGHDALDHLQTEIKKALASAGLDQVLLVRSKGSDARPTSDDDVGAVARRMVDQLIGSELVRSAPDGLRARVEAHRSEESPAHASGALNRDRAAEQHALRSLILDAANIFLSTANSQDVERLVGAREQFDWVIIEEAAKATGPELVGPLLLSGRRLLIGDHHQLAPMEAERVLKILQDTTLVSAALALAKRHVAPIFGDAPELDALVAHLADPVALEATVIRTRRLLEPFRSFVGEDATGLPGRATGPSISATLTEQRRMDPAIARVVSSAFYEGRLTTEAGRAARATEPFPYQVRDRMPRSPIVVIDFPHVSLSGKPEPAESGRPRWSNRGEVESVIDVLCRIRPPASGPAPTLAVLSPYAAQVARLNLRMRHLAKGPLAHLTGFSSVRSGREFVGTVDSFQGNEADLVILSLVRNNAWVGRHALGFLRDRRRMNVALSRAKRQLVIVGSLRFLEEAVRGPNPKGELDELSFLRDIVHTLRALANEHRDDGVALATILSPAEFRRTR